MALSGVGWGEGAAWPSVCVRCGAKGIASTSTPAVAI